MSLLAWPRARKVEQKISQSEAEISAPPVWVEVETRNIYFFYSLNEQALKDFDNSKTEWEETERAGGWGGRFP